MRQLLSVLSRLFGRRRGRRRPNVLWICADDYYPSVSGTYGSTLARTPNLDRLAAEGIRFDRAYCTCPLSTPSRMSFLTGRYPRSVGVTLSPTPLPEDEVTIGRLLRDAGYEAVALGKTHYYDPLAARVRPVHRPAGARSLLGGEAAQAGPAGGRGPGPVAAVLRPRVGLAQRRLPALRLRRRDAGHLLHGVGGPVPRPGPAEAVLPLGRLLCDPLAVPLPDRVPGLFDPDDFTVPEVGPEDAARIPPVFRDLTDDEKRGIIAAYHTSAAYMDRNLGRILDALDRSGHADDTLVIFNSDHGYLLGEHGRFEKHCCHEEAVRSALLMRLPGVIAPGRSTAALVELIDVVPTVLELCGVDVPANVQGRSLAPLLRGEAECHRDHVISEYADNAEAMVRTDRWKLIHWRGTGGVATATPSTGPRRGRRHGSTTSRMTPAR